MNKSKKPRIAIFGTRGYPAVYGGYETWLKELCNHLSDKYEFHVYCQRAFFESKPRVVNNVYLHYIPCINTKKLSQVTHSALSTLHSLFFNYDLYFYVNVSNGPFGVLLKLFQKRTAINTDGIEWERPKWKGFGGKYFKWGATLSSKYFDVLISDSIGIQKYYEQNFKADSVMIAYGAYIKESTKPEMIKQFNIRVNDYYLVVGRMIPDNNIEEIIKGYLQSKTQKKLVIVGDVIYKDAFADRVKAMANENVIFTGYLKDQELLTELFSNSYCYIHGHAFGGTNPALLKALAYGCCILAHDNIYNREVLLNEKHGYYFKSEPESIAELINYIDIRENEVLIKKKTSQSRISDNYTWKKICDQYDELFSKMMTEKKWKLNATTLYNK